MTHEVDTIFQSEPADLGLQGGPELALSRDDPVQLRMRLCKVTGCIHQVCMVLVGDERRYVGGHTRAWSEAQQVPHAEGSGIPGLFQGNAGVNHADPLATHSASDQHVRNRMRDRNDAIGTRPEARMSQRKIDPASYDKRGAIQSGTDSCQGEGVCVMGVENSRATAELR